MTANVREFGCLKGLDWEDRARYVIMLTEVTRKIRWTHFFAILIALLLALPATISAQSLVDSLTPDSIVTQTQIRSLLESSDPRDQAWGGWFAGRAKLPEMIPLLEQIVTQRLPNANDQANYAALGTVLDALIQSDAHVSPDLLLSVYRAGRPSEALILLARQGKAADAVLLKIAEVDNAAEWFLAANLLWEHRTAGFQALLLHKAPITVSITVFDSTTQRPRAPAVGDPGPPPRGAVDPRFPPFPYYRLSRDAIPRAAILSGGPIRIYFRRDIFESRQPAPRIEEIRVEDRLRYVAAAAPIATNLISNLRRTVQWQGSEAWAAELKAISQDVLDQYKKVIEQLVAGDLLTLDEAKAFSAPKLNFNLIDQRGLKTPTLKLPQ